MKVAATAEAKARPEAVAKSFLQVYHIGGRGPSMWPSSSRGH